MFDDLFNHLIAVAAEGLARPFDAALVSQEAMRARRDEYRAKLAETAKPALATLSEAFIEAQRVRFEDWLAHPRLGHGALVDEGRLADKVFQQAVADHQASPTPSGLLDVALAACRVAAITRVVGTECIYLEPKPRNARRTAAATDRRKSRRAIQIGDVPTPLRASVAKLAAGDPERPAAIARLKSEVHNDGSGVAAKLEALHPDPNNDRFLGGLAQAAAEVTAEEPPHAPLNAPNASCATTDAVAPVGQSGTLEIGRADDLQDRRSSGHAVDAAQDDDGGAQARLIYEFVRRMRWALQPERDGRITLKPLKHKRDVTDAFAAVGHLPAVQAQLSAILDGSED